MPARLSRHFVYRRLGLSHKKVKESSCTLFSFVYAAAVNESRTSVGVTGHVVLPSVVARFVSKGTDKKFVRCAVCLALPEPVSGKGKKSGWFYPNGWKAFEYSRDAEGLARVVCAKCSHDYVQRSLSLSLYLEVPKSKDAAEKARVDSSNRTAMADFMRIRQLYMRAVNRAQWHILTLDAPPAGNAQWVRASKADDGSEVRGRFVGWHPFDAGIPKLVEEKMAPEFPDMTPWLLTAAVKQATTGYTKHRFDVFMGTHGRLPDRQSESVPIPVRGYRLVWLDGAGEQVPGLTVPNICGCSLVFRIRRGREAGNGVVRVTEYLKNQYTDTHGEAFGFQQLQLTMTEVDAHDNRPVVRIRDEQGYLRSMRISAHLACTMPAVRSVEDRLNCLIVQPAENCLLRWAVGNGRFFRITGDKIKKAAAIFAKEKGADGGKQKMTARKRREILEEETRAFLKKSGEKLRWHGAFKAVRSNRDRQQGFADDRKSRLVRRARQFSWPRNTVSRTYANWMDTFIKQRAAALVDKAVRQRVTSVVFVNGKSAFDEHGFQWFAFKDAIKFACQSRRIAFSEMEPDKLNDFLDA